MSTPAAEPTGHPRTRQEAHAYALAWVAVLVAKGYGPDQAEKEVFTCGGSVKTAGYSIFDNQIHIKDCWKRGKASWSFNFRSLAAELAAPKQSELF
jgi:hypothetical protein